MAAGCSVRRSICQQEDAGHGSPLVAGRCPGRGRLEGPHQRLPFAQLRVDGSGQGHGPEVMHRVIGFHHHHHARAKAVGFHAGDAMAAQMRHHLRPCPAVQGFIPGHQRRGIPEIEFGRDVDDGATAGLEVRQARVGHDEVVHQVGLPRAHEGVAPCVQAQAFIDARVFHHAVDVAAVRRSAGLQRHELRLEPRGHGVLAADQRNRTFTGQPQRDGRPDAAGTVRDDEGPVFQVQVHAVSHVVSGHALRLQAVAARGGATPQRLALGHRQPRGRPTVYQPKDRDLQADGPKTLAAYLLQFQRHGHIVCAPVCRDAWAAWAAHGAPPRPSRSPVMASISACRDGCATGATTEASAATADMSRQTIEEHLANAEDVDRYRAPALDKGRDILELLAEHPDGMTRAEIVKELGRGPSEIYRMLERLVARQYVMRSAGGDRHALSLKMFALAHRHPPVNRTGQLSPNRQMHAEG